MILVGNKIDLENERNITRDEGNKFAEENSVDPKILHLVTETFFTEWKPILIKLSSNCV